MKISQDDNRIRLAPGVFVHGNDLRFTFARSGGPGGQHVNKVNTKAELRLEVAAIDGLGEAAVERLRQHAGRYLVGDDELLITSEATRSQRRNREDCIERLREIVRQAATPPRRRKKTRPTRAIIERRLQAKRRRAEKKQRRQWKPGQD